MVTCSSVQLQDTGIESVFMLDTVWDTSIYCKVEYKKLKYSLRWGEQRQLAWSKHKTDSLISVSGQVTEVWVLM